MTPVTPPIDPHNLTLADCVKVTGKSSSTIRRKRQELEEIGALCHPSGWRVTIEQLAAVGLADTVTVAPHDTSQNDRGDSGQVKVLQALVEELKTSLERERKRADILEHRLDATERRMERLLPPATANQPDNPVKSVPVEQKQGFLTRLFSKR